MKYSFYFFPCDEILKKNFNPVIYFLKKYFLQNERNNKKNNKNNFEYKFKKLIKSINNQEIINELIRTKSIIAALINIYWKDSLYEKLTPKLRDENTFYALKNMIKALSLIKPLILIIEDIHWIDDDSKRFFQILQRNIDLFPILIIATGRYSDKGDVYRLEKIKLENEIVLKYLSKKGSFIFIEDQIKGKIPINTKEFIFKESEGNPFYIEQIIKYLIDNSFLDKNNSIKKKSYDIPSDINSIIISRIDRLSDELKNTVQIASIIGKEFFIKILLEIIKTKELKEQLLSGEKELIWESLSEILYRFKHALIRETAYQMQLKEKLRLLHRLIAEALIKVFLKNISEYYDIIAMHYEKAEIIDKSIIYYEKAVITAKKNYKSKEAIKFLTKLILYSVDEDKKNNYLFQKYLLLDITGKTKNALDLSEEIIPYLKKNKNYNKLLNIYFLKIHLLVNLSELTKAKKLLNKALKLIKKVDDKNQIARLYKTYGFYYNRLWDDKNATKYFKKALEIFEQTGNKNDLGLTLSDIAIFCGRVIGLDNVLNYLFKALKIFEKSNNLISKSVVLSNIGLTYYEVYLNIDKALEYFKKAFEIDKITGKKSSYMIVSGNLGQTYYYKNEIDKALEFCNISIETSNEIGEKFNKAEIYSLISLIYLKKKDYKKAEQSVDNAIYIIENSKSYKANMVIYLHQKFKLLLETKSYIKAFNINKKALKLAKNLKKKFMITKCEINFQFLKFIKKEKNNLIELLEDTFYNSKDEELKAKSIYMLWQNTKKKKYKDLTLKYYKGLCEGIGKDYKNYSYLEIYQKIKEEKQ